MRVTLTSSHLATIVTAFSKVLPRKRTLPILGFLLIEKCGEADATVTGTDLEETLQLTLPDAVTDNSPGPDSFLIALDDLKKTRLRKRDSVTLEPGGSEGSRTVRITTEIGGQAAHTETPTEPVTEFPRVFAQVPVADCPIGAFLEAYRHALTFTSTDPTRHILQGVFRHAEQHVLAATDGRRLGLFHIPDLPFEDNAILPPSRLLASAPISGETGKIGLLDDGVRQVLEIRTGPWRYQGRCIEGVYPNYRQVIPDEAYGHAGILTIGEDDIPLVKAALEQFVGPDDVDRRIVVFGHSDRVVMLGAAANESGEFPYVVLPESSCECAGDEPVIQAVNGKYFLDGLAAGFTVCRIPTDTSPWRCTGTTDGLHVVMPLRMDSHDREAITEFVHQSVPFPEKGENPMLTQGTDSTPGSSDGAQQVGTRPAPPHAPDLTLVPSDPVQELMDCVTEAQESVRRANEVLRGVKSRLRAVEKHFRARQKEYDSTRKVIESLKEAAGF